MKKYHVYMCVVMILLTGCGHKVGVLKDNKDQFAGGVNNSSFAIIGLNSNHLGAFLANNTTMGVSLVIWSAAAIYNRASNNAEYTAVLDKECLEAIDNQLSQTALLKYVPFSGIKIDPNVPDILKDKDSISQFLASNGLKGGIGVEIEYGVMAGFKKKMASKITWTVYDATGTEKSKIATLVSSEKADEVFPNTKDPRYRETYVDISKKSARDFVRLLFGQTPQYEQELSLFQEFKSGAGKTVRQ